MLLLTPNLKTRKCKQCKQPFTQKKPLQFLCDVRCAIEYSKAIQAKKEKQDWRAKKVLMKEKLKTLSQYEADAKKVFQKWIRKRDAELVCQSCGTPKSEEWHASHLWKAEIYSGVIFDERNVHRCCKKCNVFLDGNELNFRSMLEKRFGTEWVNNLERDAKETKKQKFTKSELIEIKNKYLQLLK